MLTIEKKLSASQLKQFVLTNKDTKTSEELAKDLNVTTRKIAGIKASITRNKNDKDLETTIANISKEVDLFRQKRGKTIPKNTYANHKGLKKDIARKIWVKYIIEW